MSIDSEEQGIFTSHVLLPCQNSLSTLPRIQLDQWQFFERFDSCYANPSLQLLASSKEEEQSEIFHKLHFYFIQKYFDLWQFVRFHAAPSGVYNTCKQYLMFKNRCSFPLINLSCLHLMSLWLLQFIHPFTYTTCKSYYSPTIALCHLKFTSSDLTIASCLGVCGHLLVSSANIILACDQNIDWMIHCLLRRAPLCFCLPVQSITACCSVLQFCQCVCLRSQDRKEINRIHLLVFAHF